MLGVSSERRTTGLPRRRVSSQRPSWNDAEGAPDRRLWAQLAAFRLSSCGSCDAIGADGHSSGWF